MPYPTDWSIILVVLLKNCKIGFPLEMDFCLRCWLTCCCDPMALPEYLASDRQVVSGVIDKHHTKIRVFFLFWPGHSQKNAFLKRVKKRVYVFYEFFFFCCCHPGDHRKPGEKLQCK